MKILMFLMFLFSWLWAEEGVLFYQTDNFAQDDTLNIRQKPNYHAQKIDELSLGVPLEVLTCTQNKKSKWCKITPLYTPDTIGWVNAKFITPRRYQEGYVTIEGIKTDCAYLLKCQQERCLVVTGLGDEDKVSLQTKWFERTRLHPATNFSAMPNDPEANGYCTNHQYIHEYLGDQKSQELQHQFPNDAFSTVMQMMQAINHKEEEKIASFIHPKRGVTLSTLSYFDNMSNQHFTQKKFLSSYKRRNKLFWGETEARGDRIEQDLYGYIETLPHDMAHVSKAIALSNLRNYPKADHQNLKTYELLWYENDELTKEYSYQGVIMVLELYQSTWYVVGICRDYWTP